MARDYTDADADDTHHAHRHKPPLPESLPPDMAGRADAAAGRFIGTSPALQIVYDTIERAAQSNASVFVTGASGTGKDICAQTIHALSPRQAGPFVALNCAAIPAGLLESELFGHTKGAFTGAAETREGAIARAEGGTLFLDEICDMPLDMQSKWLRFLQDHRYRRIGSTRELKADIRVICATNKNPADEMTQGRFREDLFYRLHVIPVSMPKLAGRHDDILDIADYYLHLYAAEEGRKFMRLSREAEIFLLRHDWPGNVRELQNMIRHAVVMHDGAELSLSMLSLVPGRPAPQSGESADSAAPIAPLWQVEKRAIETAIAQCGGNIPRAAALLEIAPSTIYRKLQAWENRG